MESVSAHVATTMTKITTTTTTVLKMHPFSLRSFYKGTFNLPVFPVNLRKPGCATLLAAQID